MRLRLSARIAAALAAITAVGLAACSTAAPSAPSASAADTTIPLLTVGLNNTEDGAPQTLDVTKAIGADYITVLGLETLMRFNAQGKVEPDLATSVTEPNPVTYVYHLRHGVRFWDGDPLTATDVAFSLNYDRANGSQVAFAYPSVKSITASGPYTVTVTLTHPDASWPYTPAEINSQIFEKKFYEAHKSTYGQAGTLVMGTGPWKIDSFDPTTGAELSANPHWWGGKVPIQRIKMTSFASATSEALAFRAGEIDLAPDVYTPLSFASTSGAKLLATPSCDIDIFIMHVTTAPWNDVHVRRAVAYALDRSAIMTAHGGYATPLYTLIPPQLMQNIASKSQIGSLLSSLPLYQYNLAKAKQELAESAYPHGFSASILEINDPTSLNEDQVIVAELQKIGIRLQIKAVTAADWTAVESGPASQRVSSETSASCFNPDPSAYYDLLGSANTAVGSWNVADYAPPAVDTLMADGLATSNPAQRFSTYSKLLGNLQTNIPDVGLYLSDATVALSTKFTAPGYSYWTSPFSSTGQPDFYLDLKPAK
jgi:peptide/nickel transport system substrate-binding protein